MGGGGGQGGYGRTSEVFVTPQFFFGGSGGVGLGGIGLGGIGLGVGLGGGSGWM